MLARINLEKILFLDIETVAQQPEFSQLDNDFKAHWEKKANFIGKEMTNGLKANIILRMTMRPVLFQILMIRF